MNISLDKSNDLRWPQRLYMTPITLHDLITLYDSNDFILTQDNNNRQKGKWSYWYLSEWTG